MIYIRYLGKTKLGIVPRLPSLQLAGDRVLHRGAQHDKMCRCLLGEELLNMEGGGNPAGVRLRRISSFRRTKTWQF